ncbi:MAG TPA: PHB depolymerase family esterase [Kofleriaceae bacterium]|nr:PHB depolymerase family esterase [Kofleriaceae bacterium]
MIRGVVLVAMIAACRSHPADDACTGKHARPGDHIACSVAGWPDRGFDLAVPSTWDGKTPLPLVIAYHGGGGNREAARRVTCPAGDERDPKCLVALATARGFAVVSPDGTPAKLAREMRTWNAGGGKAGRYCASGRACAEHVDDVKFTDDLLAAVRALAPIDDRRIYATGLSNGAAMAHRIGCERPGVIAAIAPVGGANQHADDGGACGAVPVLAIHGSTDPCWPYAGGAQGCLEQEGVKADVETTMAGWAKRNGCRPAYETAAIPDRDPTDHATSIRRTWTGCTAATELIVVDGGGHTWPSGWPYLARSGNVTRDFGSEVILDFFAAHPRAR